MQFIRSAEFMQYLFDRPTVAVQAGRIVDGILDAGSARLSDIAQHMPGSPGGNYKAIQRFIGQTDAVAALGRLFQADAEFVIGDATEMPRPEAYRTPYVGKLSDDKTRGFWLLVLATPYRGRALPCHLLSYSSRTIAQGAGSRNLHHWEAFEALKDLLGDKPLVLDRDFSYLELLQYCVQAQVNFVIRLNLRSHPPKLYTAEGREVVLLLGRGQQEVYHQVRYRNQVPVNIIGVWRTGMHEPLWIMSNLAPERALEIYLGRMKIEEAFRDLKSLLGLDRLMNKTQHNMEQLAALTMIAYAVGLLVGEAVRDELYGPAPAPSATTVPPLTPAQRKWHRYSGLFILLRQKLRIGRARWRQLVAQTLAAFARLVRPPVRTPV
ncbi:MAG TPA: transposase [Burkholderiaceae bacterium]|nr:transposase [Burkholderiaceae bacterium]